MRRQTVTPRDHWQQRVEKVGLTFHTLADGSLYWDESAYWQFSAREIDRLEAATAEIQRLALAAGDVILDQNRLAQMGIPAAAHAAIRAAWNAEPPALYGRLDLAFDGDAIKLLEYNADTPTGLLEAAVAQWYWLQDCFPDADQFNSIHEKLIAKWKDLKDYVSSQVYFADAGSDEDRMTTAYLEDTAHQTGLRTRHIAMHQIGWDAKRNLFVDLDNHPMGTLFKLYPWEWLLAEPFGAHALETLPPGSALHEYGPHKDRRMWGSMLWIEPIWKMMWSNKALLAILWELNPGHALLLPAYLDGPRELKNYVRKPLLGREGSGIAVVRDGVCIEGSLDGDTAQGCVWQGLASMAEAAGKTAVFGSWLVDGEPCGMGVRESRGPVTNNTSCFVPHLFR
ncbi:MAG TPA: glutathionylspermidine synthase family protein [Terracidiphilus sp.]|nr:glutathionylspermidine synthase family protein [Terracidiphilus sp.]